MEILEIERTYKNLSLEDDILVFKDYIETFYIDKKHEGELPSCCSVIGINQNPDSEPITLDYLIEHVYQCRPINHTHVSDTEKHIFECSMTVKHNIKVSDSKGPIQSYSSEIGRAHV